MPEKNQKEDYQNQRRAFMKTTVLGSGAVLLLGIPLISYFVAPSLKKATGKWVDFGAIDDLTPGSIEMLTYEFLVKDGWLVLPQRGFVWAKTNQDRAIKVFSSTCTHLACNVIWQEEANHFICPCHSGRFDSHGNPVAGPPTKPLSTLESKIEEENLLVYLTF
ncbi:MAG: ubiquinol-cytochrome c reductase iron-sulfur subunit [Deltaproteobacteria bacterium]|nr:ubiquinol-cytochrome c reductase iron-sulfur subunit [Deltaproteobacteria bacterium]